MFCVYLNQSHLVKKNQIMVIDHGKRIGTDKGEYDEDKK